MLIHRMRSIAPHTLNLLALLVLVAPLSISAQQIDTTPSTTQSQSGYPDVRNEAADPTLFPNPDQTARNAVRPRTASTRETNKTGSASGRSAGGRVNNQVLKQADTDPLPIRVAYRRAKTRAMERDPNLQTLLAQADTASTDNEKRRYLRAYYVQLFGEVKKIDPSPAMKSHLDALQHFVEQRYNPQRRAVAGEESLINGHDSDRRNGAR